MSFKRANVSVHGTNNVLLRFTFNSRQKNENETVDQYVTALRTLVIEISENTTQKKLLQDRKLTLSRAIDICRSSETTRKQIKKLHEIQTSEEAINAVKDLDNKTETGRRETWREAKVHCKYCGGTHQRKKELCLARKYFILWDI